MTWVEVCPSEGYIAKGSDAQQLAKQLVQLNKAYGELHTAHTALLLRYSDLNEECGVWINRARGRLVAIEILKQRLKKLDKGVLE